MSYRTRLLLGVCSLVVLTGMAVTWLAYRSARASTAGLARSLFREVSGRTVENTQAFVLRAAPIVESLRELADDGLHLDDSDKLAPQLLAFLKANKGVSWVSYGDRDGTFTGAFRPSADKLLINRSRITGGITDMEEHDVSQDGPRAPVRKEHDTKYDPRRRPYYEAAQRTGMYNGKNNGSIAYYNWFVYEFWRFQFVQQEVAKLAQTAIEFPPMQKGASFNLEAVKEQIEKASRSRQGQ